MQCLTVNDIKAIFALLEKCMSENKEYLIDLDAAVGDGDLGITMEKGFKAANQSLQSFTENNIGKLFLTTGMVIAQTAPSTMGTLVASGFMKAGSIVNEKSELDLDDFSAAMSQFVEGIMQRGKAKAGDKTIIDSLLPAANALQKAAKEEKSLNEALRQAYKASCNGLEDTKKMVPQHGKQVAHSEKSFGLQDPGATVGVLIIKTFTDYINEKYLEDNL